MEQKLTELEVSHAASSRMLNPRAHEQQMLETLKKRNQRIMQREQALRCEFRSSQL
jgi:hypothetical protein